MPVFFTFTNNNKKSIVLISSVRFIHTVLEPTCIRQCLGIFNISYNFWNLTLCRQLCYLGHISIFPLLCIQDKNHVLDSTYLFHDHLLNRRNCQRYFQNHTIQYLKMKKKTNLMALPIHIGEQKKVLIYFMCTITNSTPTN